MRKILVSNRYFFVPYLVLLLIATSLLLFFPKAELHIASNKLNSPFFDFFFKYLTHLGDGMVIAILTLLLLLVRYRFAIAFLVGSLFTAGIINLFKKVLLDDIYRPAKYFELFETYQLHFVEGVKLNFLQSFPSGHTGTAFNVFFFLALISPKNWQKVCFLIFAVLVGYSRVYLSQHFLVDITVGSLIGTSIMFLTFSWASGWKKKWLNYSILGKK